MCICFISCVLNSVILRFSVRNARLLLLRLLLTLCTHTHGLQQQQQLGAKIAAMLEVNESVHQGHPLAHAGQCTVNTRSNKTVWAAEPRTGPTWTVLYQQTSKEGVTNPFFLCLRYFLVCVNYFFYGETLADYFGALVQREEPLQFLARYHRFISFALYLAGEAVLEDEVTFVSEQNTPAPPPTWTGLVHVAELQIQLLFWAASYRHGTF